MFINILLVVVTIVYLFTGVSADSCIIKTMNKND